MGLKRGRLLRLEDEGADAAVELAGEQQPDDGGLDVFLLVLVCVEGVPQVLWNVVCDGDMGSLFHYYGTEGPGCTYMTRGVSIAPVLAFQEKESKAGGKSSEKDN